MRPTSVHSFPIRGVIRALSASCLALSVSACAAASDKRSLQLSPRPAVDPQYARIYGVMNDGDALIPAIDVAETDPKNVMQVVDYKSDQPPGAVVVDPKARFLYLILEGGKAMRYGVGVGKAGLEFQGAADVARKASWPGWTPTSNMIERDPERYEPWARGMEGGIRGPLGARALYLYQNGQDTFYRIHGTNEPWSIGQAVSSGCIRLLNQDIIDLNRRVPKGSRVVVLG